MEQLSLFEYQEIKNKIKTKLNETVNNFVVIGFYLKQVRDNMLYTQDGYKNMEEFAKGEFNISASTASRFMDINTRFSENGNSQILKLEYANYGYSKLQEMLTVKDEDLELITEDTTVKQIRELKSFEKQEEKAAEQAAKENLPIVQMATAPQEESVAISQADPFHEVMRKYWENRTEILKLVHNRMISPEDLAEELCPAGSKTFNHGVYMIFLYDINGGIKVRYYRNGVAQTDVFTYAEWIDKTNEIITDEIFAELTKPVKVEEPVAAVVEEPKKEWQEPEIAAKEQKKDKVPIPEVVTRMAEDPDNKPLPGQMTVEDVPELTGEIPEEEEEQPTEPEIIETDFREVNEQEDLPSILQLQISMKYIKTEIRAAENIVERRTSEGADHERYIKPHLEQIESLKVAIRALEYCMLQQEA